MELFLDVLIATSVTILMYLLIYFILKYEIVMAFFIAMCVFYITLLAIEQLVKWKYKSR